MKRFLGVLSVFLVSCGNEKVDMELRYLTDYFESKGVSTSCYVENEDLGEDVAGKHNRIGGGLVGTSCVITINSRFINTGFEYKVFLHEVGHERWYEHIDKEYDDEGCLINVMSQGLVSFECYKKYEKEYFKQLSL